MRRTVTAVAAAAAALAVLVAGAPVAVSAPGAGAEHSVAPRAGDGVSGGGASAGTDGTVGTAGEEPVPGASAPGAEPGTGDADTGSGGGAGAGDDDRGGPGDAPTSAAPTPSPGARPTPDAGHEAGQTTGPRGAETDSGTGTPRPADSDDGDDSADPAPAGALRVRTGAIVVTGLPAAGELLTATMDVDVRDTRTEQTGWAVDVRAGQVRSDDGAGFALDDRSYYQARDTACSTSVGRIPLTAIGAIAAVADTACAAAAWTAQIGVAVPADAAEGRYRLAITHSVY